MSGLFLLLYKIMAGIFANERTPTRFAIYSVRSWKLGVKMSGDDILYPAMERIVLRRMRMSMNIACPRVGRRPMSKGRGRAWRLPQSAG